jgi:hypothetical protein
LKLKGFIPLSSGGSNAESLLIVSPKSDITVSESGTASFTIKLNRQPTASVSLNAIRIAGTTLAGLSQGNIVISPADWNSPYTITIAGIPNNTVEGNQNFTVSLGKTSSLDPNFDKLDAGQVTGVAIDDDNLGITITPTSGLTTSNAGAATSFTVVTNKQGIAPYTIAIPITVNTSGLVNLSSSTLYFTDLNWNVPQTINVTGIVTATSPGNQPYTITVGPTSSGNAALNGLSSTVSLVNIDANASPFDITPLSGLVTTKAGGTATFQFRLTSAPTTNLQIPLSSSITTQGTVSPSFLVFTTSNWNTYKTVTITGVNNNITEGDKPYSINFGAVVGGGSLAGQTPPSVSVTNQDTNSAGIQLSSTTTSRNEGDTATSVTARLNTIPSSNVIINLSSSNTATGGTVSPATLTFTPANWNTPQNINITPVARDNIQTSNVNYNIAMTTSSIDLNYNGLTPGPIVATKFNIDNRGYTISKTSNFDITASGSTASFTIKLNTVPQGGNVVIPTSSLSAKASVSPSSLTFTNVNWNTVQTVTITGIDDGSSGTSTGQIQIGNSSFLPSAGSDDYSTNSVSIGDYNGGSSGNMDFKYKGFGAGTTKLIAVTTSGTALQATEGGGSFFYFLHLSQSPTSTLTAPLSVSNTTRSNLTAASRSLDNTNYNQFIASNRVTVNATTDNLITGNTTTIIQHGILSSSDVFFNNYDPSGENFSISIIDIDTFGFQRNQTAGTTNIVTEYAGTNNTATYRIRLTARPNPGETCSFNISSSDSTAAVVSPTTMTFTNADWNTYQNFTVTGVSDSVLNYNRSFSIAFTNTTSLQSQFNNQPISSIGMSVLSNAIVTSSPTPSNQTSVSGQSASFTVVLNSPPTANVNISSITSSNTQAGTVSPSSLSFTTANWNIPQTVTVQGVNPFPIQNGIVNYQINFSNSTSGDTNYNALAIPAISMQNQDY